jgi:hypothetical protein
VQCGLGEGLGYGSTLKIGTLEAGYYTVELYGDQFATASFTVTPDNCPSVPNPEQADANGNGLGDACDPADSDGDGFSDRVEYSTGTSRTSGCGLDAWPPDFNDDAVVDTFDITQLTGRFGSAVTPQLLRYDIHQSAANAIDTGDIAVLTARFGRSCG